MTSVDCFVFGVVDDDGGDDDEDDLLFFLDLEDDLLDFELELLLLDLSFLLDLEELFFDFFVTGSVLDINNYVVNKDKKNHRDRGNRIKKYYDISLTCTLNFSLIFISGM